jgi:hypothetical protein
MFVFVLSGGHPGRGAPISHAPTVAKAEACPERKAADGAAAIIKLSEVRSAGALRQSHYRLPQAQRGYIPFTHAPQTFNT